MAEDEPGEENSGITKTWPLIIVLRQKIVP